MRINIQGIKEYLKDLVKIDKEIDTVAATHRIRESIPFRGANVWILAFSIVIASAGLNINSTAVIIGAMLISPLMGPIIGTGLAIGTYDPELFRYSMRNLLIMVIVSLLFSTLFFALSPLALANPTELEARTSPSIYEGMIALFGGFAGRVENSRKTRGTVLSGVAIATALMPPLCTAGYGLAHLSGHFFFGAMYLFIINGVFIIIATFIGVKYLRFRPVGTPDPNLAHRRKRAASAFLIIILIPSITAAYKMVVNNNFERNVKEFVSENKVIGHSYIYDYSIAQKHTVGISIAGEPMRDEDWETLYASAARYKIKRDQVNVRQNTIRMTEAEMNQLIQNVYDNTDIALAEKDRQLQSLIQRLDSLQEASGVLRDRLDSLELQLKDHDTGAETVTEQENDI